MENQQEKKIDLSKYEVIKCKCGNVTFDEKISVLRASSLVTGLEKDDNQMVGVLVCTSCGEVNTSLLVPEVQYKFNK